MQINCKNQLNFSFILGVPPVMQGGRRNWTLTEGREDDELQGTTDADVSEWSGGMKYPFEYWGIEVIRKGDLSLLQ